MNKFKTIIIIAVLFITAILSTIGGGSQTPYNPAAADGREVPRYTLADGSTVDVTDGVTVSARGLREWAFYISGTAGTVTVTPQAGVYNYTAGAYVSTTWVDLTAESVTSSTSDYIAYHDMLADVVRIKASGCAACGFSVVWAGGR